MSNLSNRVKKAKELSYSHNPHIPHRFTTWGSKDKDYGKKYYRVELLHFKETIQTPDGSLTVNVFNVDCQKDTNGIDTCQCPGNDSHTVCYHGLGAIYQSFKNVSRLISFYETFCQAQAGLNFGGYIAKIKNNNGKGYLWCTVRPWPNKGGK